MIDIEKFKEDLKKEYNENCKKINEFSNKIRVLKINSLESRLYRIYAFSILPWVITVVFLSFEVKYRTFPSNLISPLSISVPALIGIVTEKVLTKKSKSKEILKKFSKSKLQSEILEEITKYEIEKEKFITLNKIFKNIYSRLNSKDDLFDFNINEKEFDINYIKEIESSIKEMNKQVIEKRNNINIILTKKVLKERFCRFKKKSQKFIDTITISLLGGIIFMLIYNTPIIVNNNMGNIIHLENGVLNMLAPLGTSTLICGFYCIKRMRDYNKVFKTFNNDLGKDSLSESEIDNESECLDIELKKLINDTCILKIQQEVERQKLEIITEYRISETKVSDFMKKNNEEEKYYKTIPIEKEDSSNKYQGKILVKTIFSENHKNSN